MKKEELKAAQLTHGLQHVRHLSFPQRLRQVAYNSRAGLFVVLDEQSRLHLHKEDGWLGHSAPALGPLAGLLYASQVDKYVAWDQASLQVLGPAFEVLSKVPAPHGVRCCLYSPVLTQVVTAGAGSLSIWAFRYGSRQLHCQLTVQQGLCPHDAFTRLALDTGARQQCYAACGTGLAVLSVSQGKLLTYQRDLHTRAITDVTYCEAGACVVTASRDTTIKVWDEKLQIQTIFVGHTGPVTAVTIFPQRPLVLSASQDGTMRTWNLQTIDQVDEMQVVEVVEQLQTHPEEGYMVSLSGSTMDLWKVNQLYALHTRLGAAVTRLSTVDLSAVGSFPVRAVCVCRDSCVRLVAAHTGQVLCTLLLDRSCQALAAAYCLPRETLFVLLESGQLLRVNAAVSPMSVRKTVAPWSESERPSCLLLYSHLVEPGKAYAQWREVVEQKGDRKAWAQLPLKLQDKNRYLPVLGLEDGSLCVVQWFTGRIQYRVEAHEAARVTALAAYPLNSWIISAGDDRTVKAWRIFPYIDECLTLLLSFSCQHPVLHMCPLGSTLGTAIQDPNSATYSILLYDLLAQTLQEHSPEDDPLDEITGLCCCPMLKLFASASRDGSVKIWTAQNQLLRHLKLNTIPESLAFANECGDLLLGVEQHLYHIHHSKYLPRPYLTKLLCLSVREPLQDPPLPTSESSLRPLSKDARQRLHLEPRSLSIRSPAPLLRRKPQEDEDWSWALEEKEEACAQLAARDQDLLLLQQGKLAATRRPPLNKKLQDEAFECYMHLVYRQQPKVQIPRNDAFNADAVLEACVLGASEPCLYVPGTSCLFLGAGHSSTEGSAARQPPTDPAPDGPCQEDAPEPRAAPRSHAALPPPRVPRELQDSVHRTSPATTRSQISQAPAPDGPCQEDAPEPRAAPRSRAALPPPRAPRELQHSVHRTSPATTRSQISQAPTPDGPSLQDAPEPRAVSSSRVALPPPRASKLLQDYVCRTSLATIRSQISQARQAATAASQSQHSSLRSPSSSRQVGPSPSRHISQLSQDRSYLRARRLTSGSVPNSVVLQQLRSQEEVESLVAMWMVEEAGEAGPEWGQELEEEDEAAWRAATPEESSRLSLPVPQGKESFLLTQPEEPGRKQSRGKVPFFLLQFQDTEWFQRLFPFPGATDSLPSLSLGGFVRRILEALLALDYPARTDAVQAILTLHEQVGVENGPEVCRTLLHILNQSNPPTLAERTQRRFVLTSLNALLAFGRDSQELVLELMAYFLYSPASSRGSVRALFAELGLEDPHSYFYKEMDSWEQARDRPGTKAALRQTCAQWLAGVMQDFQAKGAAGRNNGFPLAASPEPIDAINHFCKMQMQRDLEALRQPQAAGAQETKNTVLAWPSVRRSQAILRLGETNTLARKRPSQRFYLPRIFPLPLLKGFVHAIKLPLPRINVNPFPPDPDVPAAQTMFISMDQKVRKYFIPKLSLADSYP
ncbi:WD repeat-containing protein 97 [Pelodiscus sinensis]|uniref:WD repeat-containing protein 97 n=1 Tax=Pelodiscus sinensis TaxID=13735 RepID=UPI003F6D268E